MPLEKYVSKLLMFRTAKVVFLNTLYLKKLGIIVTLFSSVMFALNVYVLLKIWRNL